VQERTETIFNRNTEQFAALNGIKPQSVRAQVCRIGSYFGITPLRLANGRLMWPDKQAQPASQSEAA
jgi:hypothetical protein